MGAGKTDGAMDAGNLLKPMLARGQLRCIGTTICMHICACMYIYVYLNLEREQGIESKRVRSRESSRALESA